MTESDATKVLYAEKLRWPFYFPLLFLAPTVIVLIVMLGLLLTGEYWALLILIIVALDLSIYFGFSELRFEVTDSDVSFGFVARSRTFPLAMVVSCEPYELEFSNYLGIGIHGGRDGTIAFNTRNGPGIKLVIEGEEKPFVIAIDDPAEACRVISAARAA